MPFAPECFRVFQTRATFWWFLKNFPWPPFALFQKMRVLGDLAKIALNWPFGHFWSRLLHHNLLQSLQFKSILIGGLCHFCKVLLGLSNENYFLGDFWKICLAAPFALFQKMRVLGDFAKIAITWPFGYSWSRFLHENLLQSLQFKCILIRG